jgi:hypothetical protein
LTLAAVLAVPVPAAWAAEAVTLRVLEDTQERIVVEYELGGFTDQSIEIDGSQYAQIALGTESLMKVKGAPELPNVCRSFIIPADAKMEALVLAGDYYEITDIDVVPSKGFIKRNVNPKDVPYTFGEVYAIDAHYPPKLVDVRKAYIMRDFRGLVVELNAFQYNPVARTLRVHTSVTVALVNTGPGQVNVLPQRERELSLSFDSIYEHHFVNYERSSRYVPLDEAGDLLVIYHDPWQSNIQPLVDHRNAYGINTTAVAVSTIGNNAPSIKNYIQGLYDSGDLAFVLLVGDGAEVATPYASGGSSDPSYSLLAGGDNYPDILVGRFSAQTPAQVDTQVERTIEYDLMPATQQAWFKRGTGIASNQGPGDDGEYDNEHVDNIRDDLLAYGYTEVDQFYDPSASASQVTNALNAGRGIINYCGHGSTTAWSTTGFSNTHVNNLANDNMLPFIISVACVNGQFDGYTCFAEAWLRATNGGEPTGAIGMYASSINQSWNPPMCAQDESVDLLVSEAYFSFGALCFAGSCQMMDEYGGGGIEMFNTWHVFGDPAVRVFGTWAPATGLWVSPSDDLESTGPRGGPFPQTVVYNLENRNEIPLEYTVTCSQPWVSIDNSSGSLPGRAVAAVTVSINAAANDLPGGPYSDTVEFINITDHDGDTTRGVVLQVGGPEWDPVAYDVSAATARGVAVDVSLFGSDPNGDPLTFIIEGLPTVGTLSDPGAGSIDTVPYELVGGGNVVTYTPPCCDAMVDTFTFTAQDPTWGSNVAVATVTMGGPAFDPVAFDVQVSTLVNLTTEINLAGSDPNGDPLTYVIDSLPASGILSDPGAGTIESVPYELVGGGSAVSYTPPCGETPVAEFGFLVQDQTAESNLATVTVTVTTSGLVLLHDFPMTSDPGWSAEGDWAFGQPAGGGTHNGDPAVGHTGNNVCGYNLGGDYGEDLPAQYLTSPALDLSVASTVELRFWRWLGVEGHFDEASVQVSNDGMSWTTVWANGSSTITDTSWTEVVLDLSAVADNESTVFIRWGMGPTDGSVTYPGWNLVSGLEPRRHPDLGGRSGGPHRLQRRRPCERRGLRDLQRLSVGSL